MLYRACAMSPRMHNQIGRILKNGIGNRPGHSAASGPFRIERRRRHSVPIGAGCAGRTTIPGSLAEQGIVAMNLRVQSTGAACLRRFRQDARRLPVGAPALADALPAAGADAIIDLGDRIAWGVRSPDGVTVGRTPSPTHNPGKCGGYARLRRSRHPVHRPREGFHLPADAGGPGHGADPDPREVALVRAGARREPLPGYAIHAGSEQSLSGFTVIETWRGPCLALHVQETDPPPVRWASDAAGLAGTIAETPDVGRTAAFVAERVRDTGRGRRRCRGSVLSR